MILQRLEVGGVWDASIPANGLSLAYFALMGAMVSGLMPMFDLIRSAIFGFLLLPVGLIGLALLVYANWR